MTERPDILGLTGQLKESQAEIRQKIRELTVAEWRSQLPHAAASLELFAQEHTPDQEATIQKGLQRLVADIQPLEHILGRDPKPPEEIDWLEVRTTLQGSLRECLTEEVPQQYTLHPNERSMTGFSHQAGSRVVTPRQVSMFLDYYGLTGEKLTPAQMAERYEYSSPQAVRSGFRRPIRYMLMTSLGPLISSPRPRE